MSQVVTAALPWWNERPEDLYECVKAAGNVADRIVALDGAYARYPEATARSADDQCDAIRDAAAEVGLRCKIVQPDTVWAGQVEKRAVLLGMAAVGSHWLLTIDADHIIKADREAIRLALRKENVDVIEVPYVTPTNPDRKTRDSAVGQWHALQTAQRIHIPHIWRTLPGLTVEKFHWWYSAHKNGHKIWLWGGDGTAPVANHGRFNKYYEIEHRALFRTEKQIKMSRAFLNDRQEVVNQTGQEDDRPELARPKFDYSYVPW